MTGRRRIGVLIVVALAIGIGYAALRVYSGSRQEQCYACQRSVHAHMRTIAIVNGRPRVVCCPACALSEHLQEGKPIQITELTAFLTGAKLKPATAFVVKGSDVNICAQTRGPIDVDKRPAEVHYDRCAPSLLAFGQRGEAAEFTRMHGGKVLRFSDITSTFGK